ncbi:hypothetical protein CC86DRAFT_152743 [Ophiobolus disseminans]|uniref:Uncharacterized protein n=1 Tax=Ophiobolus disseminans TaxID=1469910 RepID=A0A6A6ZCV9_9PLEO|nr:hypothetical protein CC86DRAFT_152743 [Ophiobolus disseminans]
MCRTACHLVDIRSQARSWRTDTRREVLGCGFCGVGGACWLVGGDWCWLCTAAHPVDIILRRSIGEPAHVTLCWASALAWRWRLPILGAVPTRFSMTAGELAGCSTASCRGFPWAAVCLMVGLAGAALVVAGAARVLRAVVGAGSGFGGAADLVIAVSVCLLRRVLGFSATSLLVVLSTSSNVTLSTR